MYLFPRYATTHLWFWFHPPKISNIWTFISQIGGVLYHAVLGLWKPLLSGCKSPFFPVFLWFVEFTWSKHLPSNGSGPSILQSKRKPEFPPTAQPPCSGHFCLPQGQWIDLAFWQWTQHTFENIFSNHLEFPDKLQITSLNVYKTQTKWRKRNLAPPLEYEILWRMISSPYELVQNIFHQQYLYHMKHL